MHCNVKALLAFVAKGLILCSKNKVDLGPASYRLIIMRSSRVSVQGVESLWGDCRFIPADWGP